MWGLPHPREILEPDGSEPWWFESGHDWNLGAAYPHGIETRFRDAQLAPIFGDLDGFVSAAQELQYRALKRQIETLRWERPISGYVITELNDVQWESNGLMDVQNRPRAFAERLANLQRPWLVIAQSAAHGDSRGRALRSFRPARRRRRDAGGRTTHVALRRPKRRGRAWARADDDRARPPAPPTSIAIVPLELEARDGEGRVSCRATRSNSASSRRSAARRRRCSRSTPAASEPARRGRLAESRRDSPEEAEIVLATRLTTPVREALIAGRKVLLIANSADALIDPERKLPLNDRHNFPSMLLRERARNAVGRTMDGRVHAGGAWTGPGPACPAAPCSTNIGRASAQSCADRFSLDRLRRTGRRRRRGRMAASRRRVREAQLSRQGLAHRVDLRSDVATGAREPACAASPEGAGGELSGAAVLGLARDWVEAGSSFASDRASKDARPSGRAMATQSSGTQSFGRSLGSPRLSAPRDHDSTRVRLTYVPWPSAPGLVRAR